MVKVNTRLRELANCRFSQFFERRQNGSGYKVFKRKVSIHMLATTFDKTCSDVESAILAAMTEQGIPAAAHDFVVTSSQSFFDPSMMEVTMLYKPLMFRRRFSVECCAGIMPIEYKRYFRDQIYLFVKEIRTLKSAKDAGL